MTSMVPVPIRDSLRQLVDNVFGTIDRLWPGHGDGERREFPAWPMALFQQTGPTVDVSEDDDNVTVRAEMPGLEKDDFNVEIMGRRLTLRGEKKCSHEERNRDYSYSECSYGSFSRTLTLPTDVEVDKADAKFHNGVLTLTLPKTEEAKSRRVRVPIS